MMRRPRWDPRNQQVPPGHPCRFSFPLSFVFSSPFCRSPCSPSLFLFRSFVVFSFSVCFLYRLRFSFRLPTLLGGGFCYSVSSSRRCTPPVLLASLKYAYSPSVLSSFSSSWVLDVEPFYFFLLFLPFFRFRFGHRFYHPVFFFLWVLCCLLGLGFCCDSFSIRCVYNMCLDRYVRMLISISSFYFCLRYTICFSDCLICCFLFERSEFLIATSKKKKN